MTYKILLLLFIPLFGCQSELRPAELIRWVEQENNGCTAAITTPSLTYTATYLPAELLAYKQMQITEEQSSDSIYQMLITEYKKGQHFKFSIAQGADKTTDMKLLLDNNTDYLNFQFERDVWLVSGTDTMPCALAVLERSANISARLIYELSFDFPADEASDDIRLVYNGPLNEGKPLQFLFKSDDISSIPTLKP